jgi:hypothetical protein
VTTVTLIVKVGHGTHESFLEVIAVVFGHVEDEGEGKAGETSEPKFSSAERRKDKVSEKTLFQIV